MRQEKRRLLTTGDIKLAAVLRYEAALEQRNPIHGTADVLYASEAEASATPAQLAEIRDKLLALPALPDVEREEEQRFAEFLRVQNQRGFGVRCPLSVTGDLPTSVTTLIMYRHFLPGAVLTRRLIPLIVARDAPRVALPIPKSFWPDAMYHWWLAESL